jgi:hypothetical protein
MSYSNSGNFYDSIQWIPLNKFHIFRVFFTLIPLLKIEHFLIIFFVLHKIKTGYLMVRREGRWGKLCMQNFETAVEKLRQSFQVNDLGKAVCRELTFT